MTKFELKNGTIIEAEKDCSCITHDGPHWLHADKMWRTSNEEMLKRESSYLVLLAFAKEEDARLASKLRNMENLGIAKIIEE